MLTWYIFLMFVTPLLGFLFLSGTKMFKSDLTEKFASQICTFIFSILFLSTGWMAAQLFLHGQKEVVLEPWLVLGQYSFEFGFIFDAIAAAFLLCHSFLFLTISFFSKTYLHSEEGAYKFYLLLLLFAAGVNLLVLAESVDILFAGWELVGLSSILLIGYFNRRVQPVSNALKVFRIYKLCDVALLTSAIWLHVFFHQTSLIQVPEHARGLTLPLISCLIVFASLGKSGQFPFCNWLRLAIEGPTPSSTIFYGSISTHLGVFLLIRAFPLLEQSGVVLILIFIIGLLSALYSTVVGRVQSDIKSSLAYSTVAQVGIIYMEIGLGLTTIALIHSLLHMCYRTYQFLLSPSIIDEHNYAEMESGNPNMLPGQHFHFLPSYLRNKLYYLALNRFNLESSGLVLIRGAASVFDFLLSLESHWIQLISGKKAK